MKKPIGEVSERLKILEEIFQIEQELNDNLVEIKELERFIKKVCDTYEDMEEPLSKIENLNEINEELNNELEELFSNLKNQLNL